MDFWELTVRFFSLADSTVQNVVAGSMLLGAAAGGLSTFVYLQKRSLLGDALAHAALPGVGIAFLIVGTKHLPSLLIGAAVTAWLGALAVNAVIRRTAIKLDSALGIVLSVFFGLGVVILTYIQKTGSGSQAGLDKFLFGQAAALTGDDVRLLAWVAGLLAVMTAVMFCRFKILSFDPGFAQTVGLRVNWLNFLLTTMIVAAVVIGLQAVGVVLMAAMLITPAAAARQWTDRLWLMTLLASAFGAISGLLGAWISFLAPRFPTGPWIVVVISLIFGGSILFAPERGVVSTLVDFLRRRRKMTRDHVLKALFKAGTEAGEWRTVYTPQQLAERFGFASNELRPALATLTRRGQLVRTDGGFRLSDDGREAGARVVRLHRLWEVYLTRFLDLPPDHVHRDAHDMEHILTPELEARLEQVLQHPETDPHDQKIPYPAVEAKP